MYDSKLADRSAAFQNNLLEESENRRLSLRKDKLEDYFQNKRLKIGEFSSNNELTINEDDIVVTDEILIMKNVKPNDILPYYKEILVSTNVNNLKYGILHLKKSIKNDKLICEILNDKKDNLLNIVFNLLGKVEENCIKFEILIILFDIISYKNADLQPFYVNPNSIEIYKDLLQSGQNDIICFVLLILGNIIHDSIMARNIIIHSEIINIIFKKVEEDNLSYEVINTITWLLSNCVNKKPEPKIDFVEKCFCVFEKYIFLNHEEILKNCYWGLCRISDTSYDSINRMFLKSSIIPKIIETEMFKIKILKLPIVRIFGNIYATEKEDEIYTLTSFGVIDVLEQLLNEDYRFLTKEVCWALTNFMSTGEKYAGHIYRLYPQVVKTIIHLCCDNSFVVRKEAINALYYLSKLINYSEMKSLIEQNFFNTLIHSLSNEIDQGILYMIVKIFEEIFIKERKEIESKNEKETFLLNTFLNFGGYEKLKKLIAHPNKEINHFANNLITNFHMDIN